jgi:hypothetical protein
VTEDNRTPHEKYRDAGMAVAYHASSDMKYGGTLSQLTIDAINAYNAAREAWDADIARHFAGNKEVRDDR